MFLYSLTNTAEDDSFLTKFLLILLLILLIATPQLLLAVLLLILMGAIMEMIRILSLSTSSGRRLGWQK